MPDASQVIYLNDIRIYDLADLAWYGLREDMRERKNCIRPMPRYGKIGNTSHIYTHIHKYIPIHILTQEGMLVYIHVYAV